MLYLLLYLLPCFIFPQDTQPAAAPFIIYKWHEIYFEESFTEKNKHLIFEGNGYYKTKEEKIKIIAFDTLPVVVKIYDQKLDTIVERQTYNALPNPDFHEAWDTLEIGQSPTPLTENQVTAFRCYNDYKLLHQNCPPFSVQSVDGQVFTADSLLNKITLLNFWYYGCMPCMAEIPALNEVAQYYKDHPKVQLLSFFTDSIYIDEVGLHQFQSRGMVIEDGKVFRNKYYPVDFKFAQIPDAKNECDAFNVQGFPTNLLIDHQGEIQEIFIGASIDDSSHLKRNLIYKIDELLKGLE